MRWRSGLCALLTFSSVILLPVARPAHADAQCPDVLVLGSRGSGESIDDHKGLGPAVEQFYDAFQQRVETSGLTIGLWANGKAATPVEVAAQYPAVPVAGGGWASVANALGAGLAVSKGRFGRYRDSVAKGEANLKAKIETTLTTCSSTQLVLAGYSQGAQVTGTAYRALSAAQRDRIVGVALFGDPLLNGRARTSLGNLDRNRNGLLTNWFNDSPPGEFPIPRDKVRSYCHALDPVCQGVLRWSLLNPLQKTFDNEQHTNYHVVGDKPGEDTYPVNAAEFFANRLRAAPASAGPEATITPVDGAVPGEPFLVSAGESSDPEGRPLTYAWDLDGSGAFATVTDGAILETSFPAAGDYTIKLKVTNDAGQSAVATTSIHVGTPGLYTGRPGPPTSVTWAPAADGESGTLSWQPPAAGPPPAEGYEVVTPDGQQIAVIDHGVPASLTFQDWELPLTVVVRAINRRGASVGSAPVTMSLPQDVMVVGDSISQGSAGDFTWRYRFDKHESGVGANLTLVGPRDDLFDNVANTWNDNHTYADPAFDQHHDAIWGQTLSGAAAHIQDDVTANEPDSLLVLLGINDLGFGMSDAVGTQQSLRAFIANARAADPQVRFVFGTLLPNQRTQSDAGYGAVVTDYNTRLRQTANELSTWDSPISVAETAADIVPAADLWDGTHPNAQGEVKIAAAFADALAEDFSVGASYPRPYPGVPLGPQTSPQLTAVPGNGEAALSWSLAPGATGYYVYQKNVSAEETAFTRLPYPVTGPSWTAGLLANGSTYQYQLRAVKGTAEGVFSNIATVTPTGPVPDGVTDLSASPGNGQATLSWTPVPNASGYYVYRKNVTAGETGFTKLPWPVSGPEWAAELLAPGGTYQFQLQSVNGTVPGGMSNIASVTVTGTTPGAVTDLSASPGNGQATLSWTPVPNASGYYVYRKNVTAGETGFTKLPWPVSGSSWVAESLIPGGAYQFQLQAVNGYLTGGLSNVASATVTGATPAAVTDLSAGPSGDGDATLSWTRMPNATGYYVYVKNVSAGETAFTQLPFPVSGPTWVASGLVPGGHYQFQLRSVNGYLLGGFSNIADVTLTGTRPTGVTNLGASPGINRATLTWTPVANATGYYVYVKNVSAGETGFTQLPFPVSGSSWVAESLIPGGTYQFQLQSVNGYIRGGFSNIATVTAGGHTPSGVTDLRANPGNSQATLTWSPASNATGYYVYVRNVSAGETGFTQLQYPVTGASWVASLLTPGGRYEFRLQSVNGHIRGGFSNIANVTAGGITPAGPGNLRATAGDRAATLTWTPAANATGYYVYMRNVTTNEPNFTRLPYPVSGSAWTTWGLIAGATYQFQLRSLNGYIEGGYSAVATVTAGGAVPGGAGNLRATPSGQANGAVALSWTPAANATGYYIYERNVTARETQFNQLPYPVSGSSWLVGGLVPGATYEFQLRSLNGYILGGFSGVASSVAGGYIPRGVTDLRVVRDVFSATLLWTPVPNATGYYIYMRNVTTDGGFTKLPYTVSGPSWTVGGLTPGFAYEFYIQSMNNLLYGDFSNRVTIQLWTLLTYVEYTCVWNAEVPHSVTKVWGSGYPPNRKIDVWITRGRPAHYGEFYTDGAGNWHISSTGWLTESVTVEIFDSVTTKTLRVVSSPCGGEASPAKTGTR